MLCKFTVRAGAASSQCNLTRWAFVNICRPTYILQPTAWTKVLPPHFLAAKQQAMMRAQDYEQTHGAPSIPANSSVASATINTSGAAVGTIASADAVLPHAPLSPEEHLQAPDPSLEEPSTVTPAQESAPMSPEDSPHYPSQQSQVCLYSRQIYRLMHMRSFSYHDVAWN